MKRCPFCAEEIQEAAIKCRHCGEFLDGRPRVAAGMAGYYGAYPGYEYRSQATIGRWPLVHIAYGIDPETGRPRVARGIFAAGQVAIGLVAFGGLALGGFAFGGLGLGLAVFGGVAIGGVTFGGLSLGAFLAVGGLAASLQYAVGGMAIAPHAWGGNAADPEIQRWIERLGASL